MTAPRPVRPRSLLRPTVSVPRGERRSVPNRQTEPGALAGGFGGEERVENARTQRNRDSGAVVFDRDLLIAPIRARAVEIEMRARACDRHRLKSVGEQVQEDLIHLVSAHQELGNGAIAFVDGDPGVPQVRAEKGQRFVEPGCRSVGTRSLDAREKCKRSPTMRTARSVLRRITLAIPSKSPRVASRSTRHAR